MELTNQKKKKEEKGERRAAGDLRPGSDPVGTHSQFRRFSPLFSSELLQETSWKLSQNLPSSCFTPKILKFGGGLMKNAPVGAASFVFKILHFLKQFLPITTTPSFLLRPRTKPKQFWERQSCFGDGSKTPKNKGLARF